MDRNSSLRKLAADRQQEVDRRNLVNHRLQRACLLAACGDLLATVLQSCPGGADPAEHAATVEESLHLVAKLWGQFGWTRDAESIAKADNRLEFTWVADLLRTAAGKRIRRGKLVADIREAEPLLSPARAASDLWAILEVREGVSRSAVDVEEATEIRDEIQRTRELLARARKLWPLPPGLPAPVYIPSQVESENGPEPAKQPIEKGNAGGRRLSKLRSTLLMFSDEKKNATPQVTDAEIVVAYRQRYWKVIADAEKAQKRRLTDDDLIKTLRSARADARRGKRSDK